MLARDPIRKARDVDVSSLDLSAFTEDDLVNIVLQRSEVLTDVPKPGELIRQWVAGDEAPLRDVVRERGAVFAERAAQAIQDEFNALAPLLDTYSPDKIADIGCGYGFFDLFANAKYGSDLLLVDIEQNDRRHFGFDTEAAAYTSLSTAQTFLTANGVPEAQITLWNPEKDNAPEGIKPDLAVSFLSCGFHFPVDMYMPYFRFGVESGGAIILDLRAQTYRENRAQLQRLGRVDDLEQVGNRRRVVVWKGQK